MFKQIAFLAAVLIGMALAASPAFAINRLFDKYRQATVTFSGAGLAAAVDLSTDPIKIACVTSAYVPATTTDQFYSTIAANVVGTPQVLTYASSVGGVYKSSNNPAFSIPASTTVTYLVIYKDTGTATTSPLIAIYDTAASLPFTSGSSTTTLNVTMDATLGWLKP